MRTSDGLALGVDVGGSYVKMCLVRGEEVLARRAFPRPDLSPKDTAAYIAKQAEEISPGIISEAKLGVAVAGAISRHEGGLKAHCPNIRGWWGVDLRELFEPLGFGDGLQALNDANAHAYAEWRVGSAVGTRNFVMIALGTGVGGAIFLEGKLYEGSHGMAGEIGHMKVSPRGPRCNCGKRGCLESFFSSYSIPRELERAGVRVESMKDAFERARADRKILSFIDKASAKMAQIIINVVHLFDPEMVVLGGGVAKSRELLLPLLRKHIERMVFEPFRESFEIRFSSLDEYAGALGAALFALDRTAGTAA